MKLAATAMLSLLVGLGLGWLAFHSDPVMQTVETPGAVQIVERAAPPQVRVLEKNESPPPATPAAPQAAPSAPTPALAPLAPDVVQLQSRIAQLESALENELKGRRATEGAPIEVPAGIAPRFRDEKQLVATFNAALKEAGFPGQVSSVDCSEHPCIVFGTGFGDRNDMEKLTTTNAFAAYAKDSLSTFGFMRGKEDPANRFFGVAVLPNENDDLAGDALHKRISVRVRQMEEVSRPPPTP
jgi:hypothetical protein